VLALFHDSQETRTTDLDHVGRNYLHATCACDADELEMLLQALEYRQRGNSNIDPFIQTAVTSLRTRSARQLGETAIQADPAAWWRTAAGAIGPVERPGNGT
jgi:putative hydrolases of HD superfamily